jgi:hypothetical protein
MTTDFAPLVLRLLQGAIYDTDKAQWRELAQRQADIGSYLAKIGLELRVDREQGLAYLHQPAPAEEDYADDLPDLPRLMRRTPLSYDLTMLCVAARYHLDRFDQAATDDTRRCYVGRAELWQSIELFARYSTDDAKPRKAFEANLAAAEKLGFLRLALAPKTAEEEPRYEICRLLTALISNAKLQEIRDRLRQHLAAPAATDPEPTPTTPTA